MARRQCKSKRQTIPRNQLKHYLIIHESQHISVFGPFAWGVGADKLASLRTRVRNHIHAHIHTVIQIISLRTYILSDICTRALLVTVRTKFDLNQLLSP